MYIVFLAILNMDEEDFEDISDENETEVETGLRYSVYLACCFVSYCTVVNDCFFPVTNYFL